MKQVITPYLSFNGQARAALEKYKEIFGGDLEQLKTYGEADFPTPPGADDLLIHGRLKVGELVIMVSDAAPGRDVTVGGNVSLVLEFESDEEITNAYEALSKNGSVFMELQDTFWGAKYAKVRDEFGITWDLNYQKQA
ncbi:VOC family protein [Neobacillus notoginsengisoli]|uniref:VOC family protein n=1 Tax=Neobacillus notoginsengisoli TaxID=1578198 RepID=A0A417YS22_9BACI|nr:VOC family protein [Neobacillus notoginsengisoli]RHW38090.1 VOC family protein [Neobacillus notoginsengisoli]